MPSSVLRPPSVNPRVLFINRSYYPDAEATGQLLTELCEDLADRFEVHVICGQPLVNPSNTGYRRHGTEIHNGVTIHRVRNTRFNKRSSFGRLSNWLSFLGLATLRALLLKRPDIVIVETDPPFLCLLGSLLKRRFGCKLVAYLQDIYPDIAIALGRLRDGWRTRRLKAAFHRSYQVADKLVVLSDEYE